MKKIKVMAIMAILIATASVITGCGNSSDTPAKTSLTTISTSDEPTTAATTESVLDDTETAIVSEGLTVNDEGKVIDSEGKEVATTADGKVKVETADGKTVEVSTDKIKETNKKGSDGSNSSQNSSVKNTEKKNSDTSEGKSTQKSENTSKNSGSTANGNSSNKGSTDKSTQSSSKGNKSDSSSSKSSQSATADPHAGKTWHEAVYKTVNHPAETKKVKVVDQEAYTYEEPVYEKQYVQLCKDCGCVLNEFSSSELTNHIKSHVLAGGEGGYYSSIEDVQVGTRTVTVPEKYHYETVVVKEAWTEKVLVKEAGWY